jgi:hypothetical protein
MNEYMILNAEHEVVPTDLMTWAKAFNKERHVGKTMVGEAKVSTVFLGIDHSFGAGPPLWFETMVFGGPFDEATFRYTTWAEAEAGHARVVAALERGEDPA